MSNLLVQTIKHTNNTSAQTIDSSGRTTAVLNNDTTYRSDSGAVTQNMVQGLCKAWVHHDQSGLHDIDDSFNMTSVTDIDTGRSSYTLINNMANTTYPTPWNAHSASYYMTVSQGWDKTTASWKNARTGGDFSTKVDASDNGETAFGDLA
tara:strand:+ start:151 stop:600 length:450 start_codon:yes stop_codon:yes gene_type:complete